MWNTLRWKFCLKWPQVDSVPRHLAEANTNPSGLNILSTQISKKNPMGNFPRNMNPWSKIIERTQGNKSEGWWKQWSAKRETRRTQIWKLWMQNMILEKRHWNYEEEHETIKIDQGDLGKNPESSINEKYNYFKNRMNGLNHR